MASMNKVILIGNVGSVEVKEFGEGKFLVQISVATSSGYKKKDGEYENITEWHRCIFAIPALAERAKTIQVEGSIRTNKWTDKESGDDRSSKEISATFYSTFRKAKKDEGQPQPEQAGQTSGGGDLPF